METSEFKKALRTKEINLDEYQGVSMPYEEDIKNDEMADLRTIPDGIKSVVCGTCIYLERMSNEPTYGNCVNTAINHPVNMKNQFCCHWLCEGMIKSWEDYDSDDLAESDDDDTEEE